MERSELYVIPYLYISVHLITALSTMSGSPNKHVINTSRFECIFKSFPSVN